MPEKGCLGHVCHAGERGSVQRFIVICLHEVDDFCHLQQLVAFFFIELDAETADHDEKLCEKGTRQQFVTASA